MTDDTPPPLNREQRRAQKFHRKSTGRQDNLRSSTENNTGFLTPPAETLADGPKEVTVATPSDAATHHTGPGTGGAVETAEGTPHHEGMHLGNEPKG